jgi:nucleotide-binding universal stress UspA family protein
MFKSIISGTDGQRGRGAASLSQVIATATGARLTLVGVEWDSPLPLATSYTENRAELEAELRDVRDDVARDARTQIAFGMSPAHALRKAAQAAGADLIVVGSRHRSRLQRFASSDNAMQVFHDAPCAVAIAPDQLTPCRALTRIGVGIDATPESTAALEMALELARPSGAELVLVAVASDVYTGSPTLAMGTSSLDAYREILDARAYGARAALDTALGRCDGVPATGDVRMGDPAGELIGLSADCDLIVLGSRRWGTAARLALGSTSESVIREAQCPVLVPPRGVAERQHVARRAALENVVV